MLSISVSVQAANYDYLIVTTSKYTDAANRLKDWEASRGYKPYVIYMTSKYGNTALTRIREFYSQNGMPKFLMIIGCDTDLQPISISPRVRITNIGENSFVENNYRYRGIDSNGMRMYDIYGSVNNEWSLGIPIMTDNEFARQTTWSHNNSNSIPRGRISARTAQEAEDIIDKIIRYEWMPPTNSNYYSNALHMSLFQDISSGTENPDRKANYAYFKTTEDLTQQVQSVTGLGINVNRIYFADYMEPEKGISQYCPQKYSNGSNLPSIMNGCGSFWEQSSNDIVDVINNGIIYAMYNGGHGQVYGYTPTGKNTNQRFYNTDPDPSVGKVTDLTNVDMPTFFYNFTCWTGTFVGGESIDNNAYPRNKAAGNDKALLNGGCMCENLLRMPGGAVGAYGFAQAGTTSFCDTDTRYIMNDLLGTDKSVGECLFRDHDDWHNLIGMYFGDPSSHMFTQVPRCIYPIISQSGTNVYVSTGGVSNCTIILNSLEDPSNTSKMKVATGSNANFTGVNYPYTITVKKHNYITYTGPDNLFIQNMTFNRARDVYGSTDIIAGKNVSSDYAQGNVTISNTKTRFMAKHKVSLKAGFSVKNNGKFTASVEQYTCPTGNVRRAFINNDELADEDESMDRNTRNRFGIYPNPSDGIFTISLGEIDMPYTIEIIDMMGKVIYTQSDDQKEVVIDLSDKKSGIYHVKVFTNDNLWSNQVIIK